MTFVRIPAGEFVMGSYHGEPDTYPTTKVKIDKAFWMGELEVTNQQYNTIIPAVMTAVMWINSGKIMSFRGIRLINRSSLLSA